MTTLDVLKVAKAMLVEAGWVQGAMSSPGGFCLLGALSSASGGLNNAPIEGAWLLLSGLLPADFDPIEGGVTVGDHGARLAEWNDMPGRVKDEVLSLLQRAINTLEGTS